MKHWRASLAELLTAIAAAVVIPFYMGFIHLGVPQLLLYSGGAGAAMAAGERGVVVGQGPQFFADGRATNHLRLAFSYVAFEDIEEGIHRLGDAIREVAAKSGAK